MFKYFAIACLLGVAAGAPNLGYAAIEQDAYPRYSFNYAVNDPHTGDNKAQSEVRDGGVVRGSYSLAEPDGTVRVVDYAADPHSGFNAVVRRLGTAHHPQNYVRAPVIAAPVVAPIAAAPIAYSSSVIGHGGWGGLGLGAYSGLGSGLGLGWGGLGHGGLGHGGLGRGLGWH